MLVILLALLSCSPKWYPQGANKMVKKQELGSFPYHPLVYHLDLSILAYHLYGQTLVWPFDPYYEELTNERGKRNSFMEQVHLWANKMGNEQIAKGTGNDSYHGPGILGGFDSNLKHDPIIYRYNSIYPWSPCITNASGQWTEYLTPEKITKHIKDVYICYKKSGKKEDSIVISKIRSKNFANGTRNILLAFEGGTGGKGIEDQPASQSLMGFVLLRYYSNSSEFDIHISLRGSRSGSGARSMWQALSDNKAKGNPDWITDMGYNLITAKQGAEIITTTGSVSRGMATSMKSILPNLFECFKTINKITNNTPPKRIYVTGHSLGGGLAQMFVSSILLGNQYGPGGEGKKMPKDLNNWPWKKLKLITYGAPRVGDAVWAKKLTTEGLLSDFFSTPVNPFDKNALKPVDTTIIPSILNADSSCGFRVLIPTDPITTEKIAGGKHVGKTVYVSKPNFKGAVTPDLAAHEPEKIRNTLLKGLNDPRIPSIAWKYREMEELNPKRIKKQRGNIEEYKKLASSIIRYYGENNIYFDTLSFNVDFVEFLKIYESDR